MSGFTQLPNWLIEAMPQMPGSVFQVAVVIARQTVGYSDGNGGRKEWDRISLTQFEAATGLSRQGVLNALDAGLGRWFERREAGQWFEYKLVNSVDQIDQPNELTSQLSRPEVVNSIDQLDDEPVNSVDQQLVNSVDTQKKEKKKSSSSASPTCKDDGDDDDVAEWKQLTSAMHRYGVTLSGYMIEQYQDMLSEYGLPAVLAGLESAAGNSKAGVLKYVRSCVVSAANGSGVGQPVNGTPAQVKLVPVEDTV